VQTATEKELAVAKLSLLHAQVEPHFLYNTLASAQLLARSDPPRADEMLGHLIQYLRHSLPRTEDELSTLGAELERAVAYLEILKIRMGSRLAVQVDVPETLRATKLPPMMLQTLVENAIKHGLEPRTAGGTVWIRARGSDGTVAVTVADDGDGFSARTSGTGIGLKNVRERLRLVFGGDAALAVVANFPAGVAATRTVPATNAGVRGDGCPRLDLRGRRGRGIVAALAARPAAARLAGPARGGGMRRRRKRAGGHRGTSPRGRFPRYPHAGPERP